MAPIKLEKRLTQFYTEVKKPELLHIMQSATERHLNDSKYPLSIIRSCEFYNSQQILNAKAQ